MNNNELGDLELFASSGAKISSPIITISSAKTINFNAGFFHHAKEQIHNATYVELRFSKLNNAIVFNFVDTQKNKSSIKLTRSANSVNGSIAAKSFLSYYGIEGTGKYLAKLEVIPDIDKSWVIYLNNKIN